MSRLLLAVTVFAFVEFAKGQVVNGNWGSWSAYGSCSVTCGNGQYTRTRQCDNPAASGGGTDCAGDDSETNSCWTSTCYPNQLGNLDKNCGADNYGCVSGLVNCVTSAKDVMEQLIVLMVVTKILHMLVVSQHVQGQIL